MKKTVCTSMAALCLLKLAKAHNSGNNDKDDGQVASSKNYTKLYLDLLECKCIR